MGAEKRKMTAGILMCCILCILSLFVYSRRFVNVEVTPKWLGVMLCVGIAGIAWSLLHRKLYVPARSFFVVLTCCFLFIFLRNWAVLGFNESLLTYLISLLILFLLLQQAVHTCPPRYLFGTVILFAFALAIQGILQHADMFPFGKMRLAAIGNFDNPAGFAAALACAFPFCFLFFTDQTRTLRYAAMVAATLIAVAIILSGSRAGMLAIAVATAVWFFVKSNRFRWKRSINPVCWKIVAATVMLALPIALYFIKKDSADGRLLIQRYGCTDAAGRQLPQIGPICRSGTAFATGIRDVPVAVYAALRTGQAERGDRPHGGGA